MSSTTSTQNPAARPVTPGLQPLERIRVQSINETGILDRIETLLPSIRERREEIEKARRLPRDLADALSKTGVFSLGVPRAIGGRESSPVEIMRAIECVAAADGSTGWCTMIGTANNVVAGYMNESGAREIFADPAEPTAGIAAPAGSARRVSGGLRVSGRWSFASGITHSNWVWAGCMVMEDGKPRMTSHGPEIVHVFLPVKEVVIHDTWYSNGLCGSGSNDFSATDVFVADDKIFALLDPAGHRMEPLYRIPPLGLFVSQVACVSLGIARTALEELTALAETKVPTMYREVLADRSATQIELARAEAALGSARAFLFGVIEEVWESVKLGREPSKRQVVLLRIAASHAAETAAAVAETAATLAGGVAVYSNSSLQRHARDTQTITRHFSVAPHTWEQAGRVLLGRDPMVPAF